MTIWASEIDLRPEYKAYNSHQDINELANDFAVKIKAAAIYDHDPNLRQIVAAFEKLSQKEDILQEDFNAILKDLYDWADQEIGEPTSVFDSHRKCWLKIFF